MGTDAGKIGDHPQGRTGVREALGRAGEHAGPADAMRPSRRDPADGIRLA